MTLEDIKVDYRPREEYILYAFQSKITENFIAVIFRKGVIQTRFSKEPYEGALKVITEKSIDKYLNELKPYMVGRTKDTQEEPKLLAN